MVYGFNFPDQVVETQPLWPNGNPYCDSKIASEAILKPLADESFRIIIVQAWRCIGVGSIPWVTRPLDLMRRRLFALPNGGRGRFNPIHVRDIARALHHFAADIAPPNLQFSQWNIGLMRRILWTSWRGMRPPTPSKVPAALLRSTASLMTKSADLLGFPDHISGRGCRFPASNGTYNGNALRDSGFFLRG